MKIIKFYSMNCGTCKIQDVVIAKILDNCTIDYEAVDILYAKERATKYNVTNVPTLIKVDDNGKEIERITGLGNIHKIFNFFGVDK